MKTKKDIILVFFGGAMSGVFGAGVITSLKKLGLQKRVHSIYATSSGAHNAAYFITGDVQYADVYSEDLVNHSFIQRNVFLFFSKLVLSLVKQNIKLEKLVDIDYLIQVEKEQKPLKEEKILQSDIDFFIRVFNVEDRKIEYLNGKKDTLQKLKATSAVVPFYPDLVEISGRKYLDGDTFSIGIDPELEKIIAKNKDKKIFLIFNNSDGKRGLSVKYVAWTFLWTGLLFLYFKRTFVFRKFKVFSEVKKMKYYSQYPNIRIIEPDFSVSSFCTNKEKLQRLYKNGLEKTKEIMREERLAEDSS